jgi:hypothetical protein
MSTCPYCRQQADHINVPPLNERRKRIYNLVAKAGPDGIAAIDLISVIYQGVPPPGARIALRVAIHEANKTLREFNQRIQATRYRTYRLTDLAQAS